LLREEKIVTNVMRTVFSVFVAGIFAGLAAMPAWTQSAPAQTPSPNGAKVYFINLKDGQVVTSPFLIQFGLSSMGVAPAGVEKPNPLIDATLSGDELKQPVPIDDGHRHFGNGPEAMITLRPAPHRLQLVLGDWSHIPHTPPVMSDVITVTVR
jgi:Domain of unknown function (DUF4399)